MFKGLPTTLLNCGFSGDTYYLRTTTYHTARTLRVLEWQTQRILNRFHPEAFSPDKTYNQQALSKSSSLLKLVLAPGPEKKEKNKKTSEMTPREGRDRGLESRVHMAWHSGALSPKHLALFISKHLGRETLNPKPSTDASKARPLCNL